MCSSDLLAQGLVFDGMESWLPWLTEGEHVLMDLVPPDALVVLVEPRRMRDRASDLLDEEAALANSLAITWGADKTSSVLADTGAFPRLHLPFDRLLAHTNAPAWTMTAAPEGPSTTVIQSMGWTPVMGDSSGLVSQLRHLLSDGYRVILAADTEGSADRLQVVLRDEGLQVTVVPPGYDPDIDKRSAAGLQIVVQPVEREVQPRERSRVSQHRAGRIGAPCDGERVGQRSLFVEQIGSPITHAAGLHQHDQCVGRDQVHEHVFALGEPRQPGLHAVEHETLRESFPLVAAPRLGRHHRLGAGPHLRRRPQLTAAEQLDLGDVDGRTLILHAELAEPVDLVSPEVDADRNLRGRWEDVDDRATHGDLTAVLDLVLPPVTEPDQFLDQCFGIELLARPHDDRCGLLDMRPEALQHGLHRDHQCGRHALLRP